MNIRTRAIEAVARDAYERDVTRLTKAADQADKLMILPSWDELFPDEREHRTMRCAGDLDAFLSFLTDNTDAWARQLLPEAHPMVRAMYERNAARLLAVLREGDEG